MGIGIRGAGRRPARFPMDDAAIHTPVMLERTLELLAPALGRDGAIAVDATLGMGGHAEALLTAFPGLRLIGIDRDADAIAIATRRLAFAGDRLTIVHAVYDEIARALEAAGVELMLSSVSQRGAAAEVIS